MGWGIFRSFQGACLLLLLPLVALAQTDLAITEVYFRDQSGNLGNRVNNPQLGQQLYPYIAYSVTATPSLTGKIWSLELDGTVLCSLTGTEPAGVRLFWCTSPYTVTAGNHTLRGVMDPNGTFAESNETNNVATRTFTPGPADLVATDVYFRDQAGNLGTRVDNPLPGQHLYPYINYSVTAPFSLMGKIFSLDLDGTVLCAFTGTQAPGAWLNWCTSPWTVTVGSHSLRAVMDPDGVFIETNEMNNVATRSFTATVPDLAPTDVYFRDQAGNLGNRVDNPLPGQQLYPYISYSVTGSSSLMGKIWSLDLDGSVLCAYSGSQATGAWVSWCISPYTVTVGSHTLRALMDPDGAFAETNETNNVATRSFTATVPDLAATDVYFRDQSGSLGNRVDNPQVGQQLYPYISYSVTSSGPLTGKIWNVDLDGSVLCAYSGTQATGAWVSWCTSPYTVTAGSHTLRAVMDPDGVFAETNETNNAATRAFTGGVTDLSALELYFLDRPGNVGKRVDFPYPGQQVYPHINGFIDSSTSLTGKIYRLLLDGASLCTFSGTVPPGTLIGWCTTPWTATAGSHTLRAVMDPDGTFFEAIETNNVATRVFSVAAGQDIRIDPASLNFDTGNNRNLYVEIDWMEAPDHSHRPSQAALDLILRTFAAEGINLVIDVSNPIPHQDVLTILGTPSSSPDVQAIRDQYFDHRNDPRYYYSIWAHDLGGGAEGAGGVADLPGRLHVVSLGSFPGQTGTINNQVGTFVHEFGHNLGQTHGGEDGANYKPNYLSVMNYLYSLDGIGPMVLALGLGNTSSGFNDFGFSHGTLPSLDEQNLDETVGIGLGRAVDWNCDGDALDRGVARDLQGENQSISGKRWCQATGAQSVIRDFDNWSNITNFFPAGTSLNSVNSLATPATTEPCMTFAAYQQLLAGLSGPWPAAAPLAAPRAGVVATLNKVFTIFNDGGSNLTVSAITKETPADWITWSPSAPFTLAPGESRGITVTVDFTTAPIGQSTRRLLITSNDPDENPYPGGLNVVVNNVRPQLSAVRQTTKLILTWPTSYSAFNLESAPLLTSTTWTAVAASPVILNGAYTVTNDISGGPKFYRLKKP